jgi:hypothetical protein
LPIVIAVIAYLLLHLAINGPRLYLTSNGSGFSRWLSRYAIAGKFSWPILCRR